jgi:hypothetical protein
MSRRGEALVGSRKNVSWDGLTVRRQWRRGPSPILAREGTSMTDGGQEASTRGGEQVGVPLGGRHRARGWRQRGGQARWLLAEVGENGERGPAPSGHAARREGVRQGQVTAMVSGRPATHESGGGGRHSVNRGVRCGSGRGEKRRAHMPAWKRKKHRPGPKE